MKAAHSLQPKDNSSSLTVLRDSSKDRTFLFYRKSANKVQFYRVTHSRAVTSGSYLSSIYLSIANSTPAEVPPTPVTSHTENRKF